MFVTDITSYINFPKCLKRIKERTRKSAAIIFASLRWYYWIDECCVLYETMRPFNFENKEKDSMVRTVTEDKLHKESKI